MNRLASTSKYYSDKNLKLKNLFSLVSDSSHMIVNIMTTRGLYRHQF
jgi:hypothetical protein